MRFPYGCEDHILASVADQATEVGIVTEIEVQEFLGSLDVLLLGNDINFCLTQFSQFRVGIGGLEEELWSRGSRCVLFVRRRTWRNRFRGFLEVIINRVGFESLRGRMVTLSPCPELLERHDLHRRSGLMVGHCR